MARKQVLYIRAKTRDLFPPDEPLVPALLRIMPVVNDLRTLQKVWFYIHSRDAITPSEQDIIKAEDNYLFRLTCATVYEAAIAFQALTETLEASSEAMGNMPKEVRATFDALNNIFPKDFEKRPYGKILVQLRNSVFHYDRGKAFHRELQEHDELGNFILGEVIGASRYLLADDLEVEILSRQLSGQFEEQLPELVRLVLDVTKHFGELVDGIVYMYIRSHEEAIEEQRHDTVDLERLWSITPESAQRSSGDAGET